MIMRIGGNMAGNCICTEWSAEGEKKIAELMANPISKDNTKKPDRKEAIRMMQRLKQSGKWYPEDDACGYYTRLAIDKRNLERSKEIESQRAKPIKRTKVK